MKSKRSQEGYLLIDHRVCDGVAPDIARAAGIAPNLLGAGRLFESATITCSHCQRVVVLNPDRTRERGYCAKCDAYLCDDCTAALPTQGCRSFERIADELLNQAARS